MTMRDPKWQTYWHINANLTPRNMGEALYHLNFRTRDFGKLPEHVQESYCTDALKLLQHFGAVEVP